MKHFALDARTPVRPLCKHWEVCIGSCHAATALREDYRRQLTRCVRELGFGYLRFHGLFNDDMSVARASGLGDEIILSFSNIDNIFDFLLSIGMKPFIELGFMPDCLKRCDAPLFHYKGNASPPADVDRWGWFVRSFVEHLISRYGRDEVRQWFFEVWNEPNMSLDSPNFCFWAGSKDEYFTLYRTTALAIKSVDPALRVGGPATSNNAWIPDMLDFCAQSATPIDFVSTHHYPTDVVLGYGVEDSINFAMPPADPSDPDAVAEFRRQTSVFQNTLWERVDRGVVTDMTRKAVSEARGLPLYYTEWNSLAGLPSDGPFGASFIAKTVLDAVGLVAGYAYWTFSDIFEEGGMPSAEFHGGFGLLTLHGVPKASYRAYELLHQLGDSLFETRLADGTVDIYPVRKTASNSLQLLCVNHHALCHPISNETVRISLSGLPLPPNGQLHADIQRIDDTHANAFRSWQTMGEPEYVTPAQLATLQAASCLERESFVLPVAQILSDSSVPVSPVPGMCGPDTDAQTDAQTDTQTDATGSAELTLSLPPMGMALVTLYLP